MSEYEQREGWWVPKEDKHCFRASINEVNDIDTFLDYTPKRRVCVQAGGNFGLFASRYSREFEEVHTFEPDPLNFGALELNTKNLNNVKRYKYALGESPGTASMDYVQENNLGAHQLKDGKDIFVTTIDLQNLKNVDLIQLDVEGYEQLALFGALNTIQTYKPTIVLELKGIGKRYGYPDDYTHDWLANFGYKHVKTRHRDLIFTYEPRR